MSSSNSFHQIYPEMASKVLVRPSQCGAHNGTGQAATVGIMGADPEYVEAAEKYLPGFDTLWNSCKEAKLKCLYKHFCHDIHSIPQGEEEIDLSELPYEDAALVKAAAVTARLPYKVLLPAGRTEERSRRHQLS